MSYPVIQRESLTETLLATKLFFPLSPAQILNRPALIDFLTGSFSPEKRLVLVCAPAGYGKTTLVCDWLRNASNVCWYSLEGSDNDPSLFFTYLTASLRKVFPEIGIQAQELLQTPQPPAPQWILSSLLNDLLEFRKQVTIVLDDYQVIHTPAIHEGLVFLLDHLPTDVHIVITTRSDPALPLHRYRSRGQLLEIRAEMLRFSAEEIAGFMSEFGITLETPEIAILERRTEGWAAGLKLAALSLHGKTDAIQFIHSLAGTNRYILDYLVEEVLKNQSETVQLFLEATSILNRLCAPLCDAMIEKGENSSHNILNNLEHANLFLIPLDEERRWYRYHHLFQDLLILRLKQSAPEHLKELHRRAAEWYQANGFASDAIQHFINAEAFEQAADLVEEHTLGLFAQGELHQLVSWVRKLPADQAAHRPWLCIYQAWALAFAGKNSEAEILIDMAIQALDKSASNAEAMKKLWAEIHAMRGVIAITSGNLQEALELANLPEPDSLFARSAVRWSLGYAWRMQGLLNKAAAAFSEMLALGQQMKNLWTISTATVDLGMVLRLSGQLREAQAVYLEGLEQMEQAGARGLGFAGRLESFLANTLYEQNRLEEATRIIAQGIAHNQLWENPNHVAHAYWIQARIFLGAGNLDGAEKALRRAETFCSSESVVPPLKGGIQATRVQLWLAQGRKTDLARWLETHSLDTFEPNNELRDWQVVTHARALLAQGDLSTARKLLSLLEADARAGGRINLLIEALTLKALTETNTSAALNTLESALKLGIPAGYRRVFLDEGQSLRILLEKLRGRCDLVEILGGSDSPAGAKNHLLTAREIDILHGMAEGLSNKEIGARLYISTGTVKAHSAAIYRKMDAVNRTDAIAKAKDLGLL
jgi:LuxR family transcriptional regulator, maltose regulon positive regulatory protein